MCSSKFTVKDGICCDQTNLDLHWLEFKKREEDKIAMLKPLYAQMELTYMSNEANEWLKTYPSTGKSYLEEFFNFKYRYNSTNPAPSNFTQLNNVNDKIQLIPSQISRFNTNLANLGAKNLIGAMKPRDDEKIIGIFKILGDKYKTTTIGETGVNLSNTSIAGGSIKERGNFLSI